MSPVLMSGGGAGGVSARSPGEAGVAAAPAPPYAPHYAPDYSPHRPTNTPPHTTWTTLRTVSATTSVFAFLLFVFAFYIDEKIM